MKSILRVFFGDLKKNPISSKYRAEIDGLRAIAVLSVVIYHAFPKLLKGGFVGVDIFFVISGFLISTIIYTGLEQQNFSYAEFYIRRIKRILPSLLTVLAACVLFGWYALLAEEYAFLGKHIAGGAMFISNILLWKESGYFDLASETKPLLHLWSLGIEEQFYIFWPIFLWYVFRKNLNLLTVTLMMAFASFTLNVVKLHHHSVEVFFLPQYRFWELLSGATLAYITLHDKPFLKTLRQKLDKSLACGIYSRPPDNDGSTFDNVQSLLGAFLIASSLIYIKKEYSFPGFWALLPVIGAVLIISSGSNTWLSRKVLCQPILVWIGSISYPLYLWHWPLFSFANVIQSGEPSKGIRLVIILLSIFLAWATYRFIERPLRYGRYGSFKALSMMVALCAIGVGGGYIFVNDGLAFRHPNYESLNSEFKWPEEMNHAPECIQKFGERFAQYCKVDDVNKPSEILLLGDSNANHLYYGLNQLTQGKNLLMLGQGACLPFLDVSTIIVEGERNCQKVMSHSLELAVNTPSIKTVILSMMGPGYVNNRREVKAGGIYQIHLISAPEITDPAVIFEKSMRDTLRLLLQANKSIIFVVSLPRLNFHPKSCVDIRPFRFQNLGAKSSCDFSRADFEADSAHYRSLVTRILSDYPQVKVFDTAAVLCDDKKCDITRDGRLIYRDAVHLSKSGSQYLAHVMIDKFPELAN